MHLMLSNSNKAATGVLGGMNLPMPTYTPKPADTASSRHRESEPAKQQAPHHHGPWLVSPPNSPQPFSKLHQAPTHSLDNNQTEQVLNRNLKIPT